MEQGWIKLYRKIEHNDFLMSDDNAFLVFTKLLLFADSKTGNYKTATRSLATRVRMPHSTLYKVLRRLEYNNLIHIDKKRHYSIIWISTWTSYQSYKEIDEVLESNVVINDENFVKSSSELRKDGKRDLQIEKPVEETQRKRKGNARETYNKNKELRNYTYT
jgi:hypothetical protein